MADISKLPGVTQPWPTAPVKSVHEKDMNKNENSDNNKNKNSQDEDDDGQQHVDEYA